MATSQSSPHRAARVALVAAVSLLHAACADPDPGGWGIAEFTDTPADETDSVDVEDETGAGESESGDPLPPPGADPHPDADPGSDSAADTDGIEEDSTFGETEDPEGCEILRFHLDVDGDSFGSPDDFIDACAPSGSYDAPDDTDCCDLDAEANPEQEAFFAEPNRCGTFDFDCDGIAAPEVEACGDHSCTTYWSSCPVPACGVQTSMTVETCPEAEPGSPPLPGTVASVIATQHCR
jgi:hypothetical protein